MHGILVGLQPEGYTMEGIDTKTTPAGDPPSGLPRFFQNLERRRAERIAEELGAYLGPGERVLDLGCGPLVVADHIRRRLDVQIVGLDTFDARKVRLPLVLSMGDRTPFRTGSFDTVLIGFVLHECSDAGVAILQEAQRLARKQVLLLEEGYDTTLDRILLRTIDKLLNRPDPNAPISRPLFRPSADWSKLFRNLGFEIAGVKWMRTTPLFRTRQVLFVLRP
ncbi:MAG: methyltransferase domain-containing protein [Nitrospirae bacterium]|nr:methyltransferase domain-containing protein [Nitrospirota bacterium]